MIAKIRNPSFLIATCLLAAASHSVADGDAARGKALYESRCIACHSIDSNRVGPAHKGLFGRKAGSMLGYVYSPALAHSNVIWDTATLDQWLANPETLIPGQRMGYSVSDALDRADLIAYLREAQK